MKKILSLALALCMICACSTAAFAATINEDSSQSVNTTVTYGVDARYTVTIPDSVNIGTDGVGMMTVSITDALMPSVTADGQVMGMYITVDATDAPNDIFTLTNRENPTKTLQYIIGNESIDHLLFNGAGDMVLSMDIMERNAEMDVTFTLLEEPEVAGVYTDTITFVVKYDVVYEEISFVIESKEYYARKGMTWAEWCESDYNTPNCFIENNTVYVDRNPLASGNPPHNYIQNVVPADVITANGNYEMTKLTYTGGSDD